MIELERTRVVSFDCYGTLVDWEAGILAALRPVLRAHGREIPDPEVLGLYARLEPAAEAGEFRPYREVLQAVVEGFGRELDFEPSPAERRVLVDSIGEWPPFADTRDALRRLAGRFPLAIVSNVDDDLLERTVRRLDVDFAHRVTAEQCRSYKPSRHNFRVALDRFGLPPQRVLHVAQSVYHDIVPASELGIPTVWVRRRRTGEGSTATPPAEGRADLTVPDLASLAQWVERDGD